MFKNKLNLIFDIRIYVMLFHCLMIGFHPSKFCECTISKEPFSAENLIFSQKFLLHCLLHNIVDAVPRFLDYRLDIHFDDALRIVIIGHSLGARGLNLRWLWRGVYVGFLAFCHYILSPNLKSIFCHILNPGELFFSQISW